MKVQLRANGPGASRPGRGKNAVMAPGILVLIFLLVSTAFAESLADSNHLYTRYTGYGGNTSSTFLDYENLVKTGNKKALRKLAKGAPGARLYGAIGLYWLDEVEGREAIEALSRDDEKVFVISGCIVQTSTVSREAKNLLNKNFEPAWIKAFRVSRH